jgi:hypothetical protein
MASREFNTSGPCDPALHYMVPRTDVVARGLRQIERGRYFTIFAPRQAGKTTCFQLMLRELATRPDYVGTWVSFEDLSSAPPEIFWEEVRTQLVNGFRTVAPGFELPVLGSVWDLGKLAAQVKDVLGRRWVLIIDEFDGVPEHVLSDLMHRFRRLYHQRSDHALHSLALVGVRNITEVTLDHASPFNIAEELEIPYFSEPEIRGLVGQYVADTGQTVEEDVIRQVCHNTAGQPGLVCALFLDLLERFAPAPPEPVTLEAFWPLLRYYLYEKLDKNISNIVNKAKQQPELMMRVLFNGEVPFTVRDPRIAFLHVNGVVENVDGRVEVPVPLYKKCLLSAFQPLINGELEHYATVSTDFSAFLDGDGLNVPALLESYRQYVRRRGFRAFDTEHLREGAWHYSLDGYLSFFVERFGHRCFVEVPTGRGRTDILIVWGRRTYIIETKVYTDNWTYAQGKHQLAEYLRSEGLAEGYYVVFTNKHTDEHTLFEDEEIDGKRVLTYIVRTNLEPAAG